MWLVCYAVWNEENTHYNQFTSEEEAIKCFNEDKEYYLKEFGEGNFKIHIAEVKHSF